MKSQLIIFLILITAFLTSCGTKFEPQTLYDKTYKVAYYGESKVDNLNLAIMESLNPEFEDLSYAEKFAKRVINGHDFESDKKKLNELLDKNGIKAPTKELGDYVSELYSKRFKMKKEGQDFQIADKEYINGKVRDHKEVDNILVFDTPTWSIALNEWTIKHTIKYVLQYRFFDTKDGSLVLGDSCIYESEEGFTSNEITNNNFKVVATELNNAEKYCRIKFDTNIDPNKTARFTQRRI